MAELLTAIEWPELIAGAVLAAVAAYFVDRIRGRQSIRLERQSREVDRTLGELTELFAKWRERKPFRWTTDGLELVKNVTYYNTEANYQAKLEKFREDSSDLRASISELLIHSNILTASQKQWVDNALNELYEATDVMTRPEFGHALGQAFKTEQIQWETAVAEKALVRAAFDDQFQRLAKAYRERPDLFKDVLDSGISTRVQSESREPEGGSSGKVESGPEESEQESE